MAQRLGRGGSYPRSPSCWASWSRSQPSLSLASGICTSHMGNRLEFMCGGEGPGADWVPRECSHSPHVLMPGTHQPSQHTSLMCPLCESGERERRRDRETERRREIYFKELACVMTGVGKSGISRAGPHSRVEGWHLKEGFYAAVWAQNLFFGEPRSLLSGPPTIG